MLSSETEQRGYEKRAPYLNVADELVCQWFDDLYQPQDDNWRAVFLPAELKALEEFSELFKETIEWQSPESIEEWLANPRWRELMTSAGKTVALVRQDT
jgi:hypothetical protein